MPKHSLRKPQLASSKKEDTNLFDAIQEVGGLLPKSAGVFVALSGIAYFSGWRQGAAYYEKLGAPWIVTNIPRFSFIELSASMLFVMAVFMFGALYHIATVERDPKKMFWGGSVTLFVAYALPLIPAFLSGSWASPSKIWLCERVHAGLVYVAAGLLLGEAVARFRNQKLRWSPGIAAGIYTALSYALYVTPAQLGTARAQYHLAEPTHSLPLATYTNGTVTENWRLVEVLGQMALLGSFPEDKTPPVFRVVFLKDISTIRPPAKLTVQQPPLAPAAFDKRVVPARSTHPVESPRFAP